MSKREIEQRLRCVIREVLGRPDRDLEPGSRFVDDLGADSLDIVQLVLAVEDEFGTSIPDEDAEGFRTVAGMLDWLTAYAPG